MIIIVEGCDRTGKTTLARYLQHKISAHYIHWDRPQHSDPIREYLQPIYNTLDRGASHVVCDRHYLGELVWPRLFGRESLFDRELELLAIEGALRELGAVGVLAVRDPDELELACVDEPCSGQASEAQGMFIAHADLAGIPFIKYQHGDNRRVEDVLTLARLHETVATEVLP